MIYAYIFVMAGVTYLIRMLPHHFNFRKKLQMFISVRFYIMYLMPV